MTAAADGQLSLQPALDGRSSSRPNPPGWSEGPGRSRSSSTVHQRRPDPSSLAFSDDTEPYPEVLETPAPTADVHRAAVGRGAYQRVHCHTPLQPGLDPKVRPATPLQGRVATAKTYGSYLPYSVQGGTESRLNYTTCQQATAPSRVQPEKRAEGSSQRLDDTGLSGPLSTPDALPDRRRPPETLQTIHHPDHPSGPRPYCEPLVHQQYLTEVTLSQVQHHTKPCDCDMVIHANVSPAARLAAHKTQCHIKNLQQVTCAPEAVTQHVHKCER